jgi:hypothetical protein
MSKGKDSFYAAPMPQTFAENKSALPPFEYKMITEMSSI